MRRLGGLLAVLLLAQAGVAMAASGLGLERDSRFGDGGVVQLYPGVPGDRDFFPSQMVGTGDGGFFVLELASGIGCGRCTDWYLARYGVTGARDRGFGSVPVERGVSYYTYPSLAVDSAGRPLVYWRDDDAAVVRRFTVRGRVDHRFGEQGSFVLHCGCYPESLLALPHRRILLLSDGSDRVQRGYKGSIPVVVRLRDNGALDRTFGVNGIAHPRLHGRYAPDDLVVDPDGGVVLSGGRCCGLGSGPYVARLRGDGTIDRRFGREARRAVKRLPRSAGLVFSHGLVGHRDGSVDLYGELDFGERTFVLRLTRDGSISATFGHSGMKKFGWTLSSADPDGRNGAIVFANRRGYITAFELGPKVRTQGAPHLGLSTGDPEGVSVEAQDGETVLVFDKGLSEGCRQNCDSVVTVTRLRLPRVPRVQRPKG